MVQRRLIALDHHDYFRTLTPVIEQMNGKREDRSPKISLDPLYEIAGADKSAVFHFTSSRAEAINQVHWSVFLEIARKEGKCHFITTPVEDSATLLSLKRLETLGCYVRIAPLDANGQIDLEKLSELLTPRTALFSFSLANALTGVIQPVEAIVQMAEKAGVLVHVDATFALGKFYAPFRLGADYLTFGGEGIHSVQSSGAVFAKKTAPLAPLILGERSDPASLSALTTAALHASLFFDQMGLEIARLRDRLEKGISYATPLLKEKLRLPNVLVLSFAKIHQRMLQFALLNKGCAISLGGKFHTHLERHLQSCGFDEEKAQTCCSFALSRFTTQEEVDQAIDIINKTILELLPLTEDLFHE